MTLSGRAATTQPAALCVMVANLLSSFILPRCCEGTAPRRPTKKDTLVKKGKSRPPPQHALRQAGLAGSLRQQWRRAFRTAHQIASRVHPRPPRDVRLHCLPSLGIARGLVAGCESMRMRYEISHDRLREPSDPPCPSRPGMARPPSTADPPAPSPAPGAAPGGGGGHWVGGRGGAGRSGIAQAGRLADILPVNLLSQRNYFPRGAGGGPEGVQGPRGFRPGRAYYRTWPRWRWGALAAPGRPARPARPAAVRSPTFAVQSPSRAATAGAVLRSAGIAGTTKDPPPPICRFAPHTACTATV